MSRPGLIARGANSRRNSTFDDKPFGAELDRVKARAPFVTVPPDLEHTELESVARVMIAFAENSVAERVHIRIPRYIGFIAELAGPEWAMTAHRQLRHS